MANTNEHLGFGIITPFRRDLRSDFAAAGGEELVKSTIEQSLGTRGSSDVTQGELPWRTDFGSQIETLRHRNNDLVLEELFKVEIRRTLRVWNPRVILETVEVAESTIEGTTLSVLVRYRMIDRNVPGNKVVLVGELTIEV